MMELFVIYWYPDCPGDCEKHHSYVLCRTRKEARRIADTKYSRVTVTEVISAKDVCGGALQEYWAEFVMTDKGIVTYQQYAADKDPATQPNLP